MNILVTFIVAVVVGVVCYMIAQLVPFLSAYAGIVGLVVFLLVLFGGYSSNWQLPRR